IASKDQIIKMRKNYTVGNYGYGHAKTELFELLLNIYTAERRLFEYYFENELELEEALKSGEQKARIIARMVLDRVRKNIGF
ncbi:MAG: tryptophan--tRNA ligase, partial [Cyclobacteriaceae bacterium]|nr:tryptophan--tRNA ligase [Cyclobacteriaceae bacterium]